MVCSTQILDQMKSQEFIGHIKQHSRKTSPAVTYVTSVFQDYVKCYIECWMHLNLLPDNMLFGETTFKHLVNCFDIVQSVLSYNCGI